MKYALASLALCVLGWCMIVDIPVSDLQFDIQPVHGYDRIGMPCGTIVALPPGSPEIPALVYTYLIPRGNVVQEVCAVDEIWEEYPGQYAIYPVQKAVSIESTCTFTEPDQSFYGSGMPFPEKPLLWFTCGTMRGHSIVQIVIAPFRYLPQQRKINTLARLKLRITTQPGTTGRAALRQTPVTERMFESFLKEAVINDDALFEHSYSPPCIVVHNPLDSTPSDMPSLQGPAVDLVIITDSPQLTSYADFARLKRLSGLQVVIKTMSWIRQHYQGIDDAERIRQFLLDAYEYWGISYVLLGGDTPSIPTRYVWVDRALVYTSLWLPIASDLYYSDLDGTWNYDGDDRFGEVEDSLDLYPDVFVGRVPATSGDGVSDYIGKVNAYLFPENTTIQTKALFFSSYLNNNWPGLPYAYELAERLPQYFSRSFLDEGLNNLSAQSLHDSLDSGFGIVAGIGHGDIGTICLRFAAPRVYVSNFYFDSLTNGSLYGLMASVTCYTNPFQSDCLGEHWVLNPRGGGIAYIGPTSSSEGGIHKEVMKGLFDELYCSGISASLASAKIPYIAASRVDSWYRVHQFSISLLGDPTISLWKNAPRRFASVTVEPEILHVGAGTVSFYFNAVNPRSVHVVLYKEGETFILDSTVTTFLRCYVNTRSPGYLKYSLMADGYIHYIDSVPVIPGNPYLTYDGFHARNRKSDTECSVYSGDTVLFDVQMKNNGAIAALDVYAQLLCSDSLLTFIVDTASYGDIAPGESRNNKTPYCLVVSEHMPDEYPCVVTIKLSHSDGGSLDSFQVYGRAPVIGHFTQHYMQTGDIITIEPYVENSGHSPAESVWAIISSYSDSLLVLDSIVAFPTVNVQAIVGSAPDSFVIYRTEPQCQVRFNLRIYYQGSECLSRDVTMSDVHGVDPLTVTGRNGSIIIAWSGVPGAMGYRVYRSMTCEGPYTFLRNPLEPISRYEDRTIEPLTDYYYYVLAVDSVMNQSASSDTVQGRCNPLYANGWPQTVFGYQHASPNFGDIDPHSPGLEIICAAFDGFIYGWHGNGSPINGADPRLFYCNSEYIWSSPAIGDVDRDGMLEIVFGTMSSADNVYVIRYNPETNETSVLPGWPLSLEGGGLVSSPVLADIDNDGDLEIIVVTFLPAHIYAFHHDGKGVFAQDGLLDSLTGEMRGTPAVADINQDGDLEIICCGGSETDTLFVWDRYGNYLPPFPVSVEFGQRYSVVAGDIRGDANLELCFYSGDPSYKINCVDCNGSIIWQYEVCADYIELSPCIGDVTGDGAPEVILGFNEGLDAGVVALDSSGSVVDGFPTAGHDAFLPVIVDADDDDVCDVIVGSSEWNIHAYSGHGIITTGFPITLGNRINSSPAAFDLDQDGLLELMVSSYDYKFHVFDLNGHCTEWPRFRYDPYNSGWYKSTFYMAFEDTSDCAQRIDCEIVPNPFVRNLHINYRTKSDRISVKIYDVAGRLVKKYPAVSSRSSITWNGDDCLGRTAPCGVYFIKLATDSSETIRKVVKIH